MKEKSWPFNKLSCYLIKLITKIPILFRVSFVIMEDIFENGPVVITPSHKHWLDIPLLTLVTSRIIHYVAKEELYKNIFSKWYLDSTGSIPVKRGENDKEATAKIVETIANGGVIAIYPEGSRNKGEGIGELHRGIGIMLLKNELNPPIFPVAIAYKKGRFLGLPIHANIGIGKKIDPLESSKLDPTKESISDSKKLTPAKILMLNIHSSLSDLYDKIKFTD